MSYKQFRAENDLRERINNKPNMSVSSALGIGDTVACAFGYHVFTGVLALLVGVSNYTETLFILVNLVLFAAGFFWLWQKHNVRAGLIYLAATLGFNILWLVAENGGIY